MRTAILAVLLALLIVFAGCASPQDEPEEGGEPGQAESPTTADNDAGAEPVNPPNETNGTESGGTVNPADEGDPGANESGETESGADETVTEGADTNVSGANQTGDDGEGSYQVASAEVPFAAVGQADVLG